MIARRFEVGDRVLDGFTPVRILEHRHSAARGWEYRVSRTRAEPVGYRRDGSVLTSFGYPYWTQQHLLERP